jgi:hypothetical protein
MTIAQVQVSINGGGNVSGGVTAPFSATVALSGVNTSGWTSALWQIYDYPPGFSAPAGWSTDAFGVIFVQPSNPTVPPPSFTLPASGSNNWGKFAIRLRINNNPLQRNVDGSQNVNFIPTNTDEATIIKVLSPVKGMGGVAANESSQFDNLRAWIGSLMADLRLLDSGGSALSTYGGDLSNTSTSSQQWVSSLSGPNGSGGLVNVNVPLVIDAASGLTWPTVAQIRIAKYASNTPVMYGRTAGTTNAPIVQVNGTGATLTFGDNGGAWNVIIGAAGLNIESSSSTEVDTPDFHVSTFGGSLNWSCLTGTAVTLQAATAMTAVTYKQADNTANSTTGALSSYLGQNSTGTTAIGGSVLIGSGTSTSTATFGTVALAQGATTLLSVGDGGAHWRAGSGISIAAGGTFTLTLAQSQFKDIVLTGSLAGNATVVLPSVDAADWIIDATGVTLNAHTITLQANGNNWGTTIGVANTYRVTYRASTGKLYGGTFTP